MAESGLTPKPGHDHLIPQAAWRMYPERHISNSDWKKLEAYAGHEDWSGDRWAWEFLRRNRFFQRDCDEFNVALGKKQRLRPKLNSKWMLQAFKSYDEQFSHEEKGIPPPRWSLFSSVECWDTNTPQRLKQTPQPWQVDDLVLQPGQIAIVLDLNGSAALPEVLELQWFTAWYKMHMSAKRLHGAEEKRAANTNGSSINSASKRISLPHKDKRIDYLRIADAFSGRYPASLKEVCEMLHAEERLRKADDQGKKNTEFSLTLAKNSLYKMIEASRNAIYGQGYLLLLAEEAKKSDWQARSAPYWPLSKGNSDSQGDEWGVKPIESSSPFAALLKTPKRKFR